MSIKTVSEEVFEEFCVNNGIVFGKIPENLMRNVKTPDYEVTTNNQKFIFEIKQLDKDVRCSDGSWSLTPGELIRRVTTKKNRQVKESATNGLPTILLIYNHFDLYFQTLGTDQHDFVAAMYGDMTMSIDKASMQIVDSFHGENSKCQPELNTSFSAIGGMYKRGADVEIEIYENVYAKVPMDFDSLPSCINAHRVSIITA